MSTPPTVTCANCGKLLDEDPTLTTKPLCPHCGSHQRLIRQPMTANVKTAAELVRVRIRRDVQHHPLWWTVNLALILGGAFAGLSLGGWYSFAFSLATSVLGIYVGNRATVRIIERDHYPPS